MEELERRLAEKGAKKGSPYFAHVNYNRCLSFPPDYPARFWHVSICSWSGGSMGGQSFANFCLTLRARPCPQPGLCFRARRERRKRLIASSKSASRSSTGIVIADSSRAMSTHPTTVFDPCFAACEDWTDDGLGELPHEGALLEGVQPLSLRPGDITGDQPPPLSPWYACLVCPRL